MGTDPITCWVAGLATAIEAAERGGAGAETGFMSINILRLPGLIHGQEPLPRQRSGHEQREFFLC
jgi:hypothetical protein